MMHRQGESKALALGPEWAAVWPSRVVLVCLGIAVAVACADSLVQKVNLAILFAVPLVIVARTWRNPAATLRVALVLSVLTYADYLVKRSLPTAGPHLVQREWFLSGWFLNRGMVVLVLMMIAGVSATTQRQLDRIEALRRLRAADPEEAEEYDNRLVSFEQSVWVVVCAILMVAVLAIDVLTPPQWNLPILYVLPVVISAWGASRYMLWGLVPFALLGNVAGFYMGPRALDPMLSHTYAVNRVVAAVGVVVVALVVNALLEAREGQTAERHADVAEAQGAVG
jgi:hypothetical protein